MMRSTYKIFGGLLCLLALLLAGCSKEDPTPSTTAKPRIPPLEQYAQALVPVENAENLILSYTASETRTAGSSTLPRSVTGTASYSKLGKRDMVAVVEESLQYGSYTAAYTEAYCDSLAYAVVNGSYFSSQLTPDGFLDRQIPAILITGTSYGSVAREFTADSILLTFTRAKELEPWVTEEAAGLISASGTVILDTAGNLVQSTYQASYMVGDVRYDLNLSVRVTTPKNLDLGAKHPAHDQDCVAVDSIDALKYLMQVAGDVYSAKVISCQSDETIVSEAIPLSYTQSGKLTLSGFDEELYASAQYQVALSDYRGEVTHRTQEDLFADGVFSSRVNDGEPVIQSWITAKQMRRQTEDEILSGLMAVKYLAGATLTDNGSTLRLEFTGNEAFCADLMETITDFLKVDLDAAAETVQTGLAGGYLVIRKDTGLPTEMGIYLNKIHTINTVVYKLHHTLSQCLCFD